MYYNGRRGKTVETFLTEVHKKMETKYSDNVATASQDAKELQLFFQELKTAARWSKFKRFY